MPIRTRTLGSVATLIAVGILAGSHLLAGPTPLRAQEAAPTPAPYVDQLQTSIRGLSTVEIDDLRSGRGMGLARPAEINGYPGPRHVLDLASELALSEEQRTAVQTLFDQMEAEAAPLGEQFLTLYAELERSFRAGTASAESVAMMTAQIGQIEGQLRASHLKYHLLTRHALTDEQNAAYARLRGYQMADGAPVSAPQHPGHQPGMQHPR
jgi:hypothetical protein